MMAGCWLRQMTSRSRWLIDGRGFDMRMGRRSAPPAASTDTDCQRGRRPAHPGPAGAMTSPCKRQVPVSAALALLLSAVTRRDWPSIVVACGSNAPAQRDLPILSRGPFDE